MKKDSQKTITPFFSTTIAACSTGFPGAIAIIRLSGAETKKLLERCFFSKSEVLPRFLKTGIIKVGEIEDTAMAVFFEAPDSYTGEDMAEINVHANPIIVEKILEFLIKNGATAAQKGEFTYRAFINGKMDLTAAEAVTDIINAESELEIKYAYKQIKGEIKQKIEYIQEVLENVLAEFDVAIDFPEENFENNIINDALNNIFTIKKEVQSLIRSYENGKFIKNGVKIAIIGGVNVGKSSILNVLLKKDRAIVTNIPGTTRDTLEDRFEYKGQKFIITDTAGIRNSKNKVEKEGIERTLAAANESDVIIAVAEAGAGFSKQIETLLENLKNNGKKIIITENKTDIYKQQWQDSVAISAKTGCNIETLKEKLYSITAEALSDAAESNVKITELRHYQSLILVENYLCQAENGMKEGITSDFIAADLIYAFNELGKITGKSGADEIIKTIFSRFCVGK